MKKVIIVDQKIRLSSILALEIEVNGFIRQDEQGRPISRFTGLISQKLNATTKYWLNKLSKKLEKEKEGFEKVRKDLIQNKYGVEADDEKTGKYFHVPEKVKDPNFIPPKNKKGEKPFDSEKNWPMVDNPEWKAYKKEINELSRQLIEIKMPKFDINELFNFQTEQNYSSAYHFLVQEEEGFIYEDLEYPDEEVESEESSAEEKK